MTIVDHTRKNHAEDRGIPISGADIFGPMQKWATADQVIVIARPKSDQGDVINDDGGAKGLSFSTRTEVFVEGRDVETVRFFLDRTQRGRGGEKFSFGGSVEVMAETSKTKAEKRLDQFARVGRDLHREHGRPVTVEEIRVALVRAQYGAHVIEKTTAKGYMTKLVSLGQFRKIGAGRSTAYEPFGYSATTTFLAESLCSQENQREDA